MLHQSLLNVDNDDQEKKTNATIIICAFGQGQGPVQYSSILVPDRIDQHHMYS